MDKIKRYTQNPVLGEIPRLMVEADDGKWVRHEDVARWWREMRGNLPAPLVGDDLVARAEHAYQAITLKPHDALSSFDVTEAASCIALLGTRLRAHALFRDVALELVGRVNDPRLSQDERYTAEKELIRVLHRVAE